MDSDTEALHKWAEVKYGEIPEKVSIWATDEVNETLQALLRFSERVVIADLHYHFQLVDGENHLLEIELLSWQPGSIQARRLSDGYVRIKHRTKDILLNPQIRAPEWAAALLEEWLMDMRGDAIKPKSRATRISNLVRKKETISRLLEQADFTSVESDIQYTSKRLDEADDRLSGKAN